MATLWITVHDIECNFLRTVYQYILVKETRCEVRKYGGFKSGNLKKKHVCVFEQLSTHPVLLSSSCTSLIHEDDCTQVINEHPATIFAGKVSGRLSSMELFFGDAVKMLACDFGIRSANDKLLSLVLSVTDFLFLHPSLQPPDTVDVPRIYLHRGASRRAQTVWQVDEATYPFAYE